MQPGILQIHLKDEAIHQERKSGPVVYPIEMTAYMQDHYIECGSRWQRDLILSFEWVDGFEEARCRSISTSRRLE